MPMSNAERQRRDTNLERRAKYLQESKEKYEKDKTEGKRKNVPDMTDREKRQIRKVWRLQKRKQQQIRRANLEEAKRNLTPPSSPELPRELPESRQKKQEVKRNARLRAKCYRDLKSKTDEIEMLRKKAEMYRKRWFREKQKNESPRSKTRKLLHNLSKPALKKLVFMGNVVIEQIRKKYKETKKQNKANIYAALSGSIVKKYGLKTRSLRNFGIEVSRRQKKEKTFLSKRIMGTVRAFYVREDNSVVVAGLKKTKTFKKDKKQRRILKDTLKNLHSKFLAESKDTKLSYSTFCRLKPFWVVFPVESDRDTCLCKLCQNTELLLKEVTKHSELQNSLEEIIKNRVCESTRKKCMYGECKSCNGKKFIKLTGTDKDQVKWQQWQRKTEKRMIKTKSESKEKQVSFTVKENISGTAGEMIASFEEQFSKYTKHTFNCRTQFRYFRDRRENLQLNECLIHIDYSENYTCKLSSEIQSMHFGASKKQLSLQTGIFYVGKEKGVTFCTVSENLDHGPAAVWCHLEPVLNYITETNRQIDTVEFFSDGPTSQYRQKGNFYFLMTEPEKFGFINTKWSFFEAGHGKGIPDAIGGSVKREADRRVKYGQDIASANDFIECNKDSKTKVWLIEDDAIDQKKDTLHNITLQAIPGTFQLHQIVARDESLLCKRLSCACNEVCDNCESMSKHGFLKPSKQKSMHGDTIPKSGSCASKKGKQSTNIKSKVTGSVKPKKVLVHKDTNNKDLTERRRCFKRYLDEMAKCNSYQHLQEKCQIISNEIGNININPHNVNALSEDLELDENAVAYIPSDLPEGSLYPLKVHADGNCLPSTASVLGFGNANQVEEMRVRIILELVQNENLYLRDDFLELGLAAERIICGRSLKKQYAQYSESFMPGHSLTEDNIQSIYREEVLSVTRNKSFMGIWQIHALSSVFKTPIFSVYPKLGNINVRKDLNRLIKPIIENESKPIYLMWTSNREDLTAEHWVPNHFVPLVEVLSQQIGDIFDENNNSPKRESNNAYSEESPMLNPAYEIIHKDVNDGKGSDSECDITVYIHDTVNTDETDGNENPQQKDPGLPFVGLNIPTYTEDSFSNHNDNTNGLSNDHGPIDIEERENVLGENYEIYKSNKTQTAKTDEVGALNAGQCVLINFNERLYVGFVEEVIEGKLLIECMRKSGKKTENLFSWPKKIKDKNWYDQEHVVTVVKDLKTVEGKNKFMLGDVSWKYFSEY